MKKIGILGGTFDPIQNAHLVLAECSYEQFDLDIVWFMPSKNPPHKRNKYIEKKEHRSEMIKLAIEDNPHFEFSDFELTRQGLTFTTDTLLMLNQEYEDTKFYFIIGEDSLFELENWKKPHLLFELAHIVVARRGLSNDITVKKRISFVKEKYQTDSIELLDCPISNISSSSVRENLQCGKSIKYYVPQQVEQYISTNKLYIS